MADTRRLTTLLLVLLGTALLASVPFAPALSPAGRAAVATTFAAGTLWVTGALPLPVTALLVPVLLTVLGAYPELGPAVAGFADPIVFLLLAGFMLAEALTKYGIDRRLAFAITGALGTSPRRLVLAVMVATAGLSMVISNTATTAVMAPIALGIAREVVGDAADPEGPSNLELSLLLGTAYAASIGGVGTLIGTPPNAIAAAALGERLGYHVGFVRWMAVGVPMVVVTLPVCWVVLTRLLYPPADHDVAAARDHARERLREAGPLSSPGKRVVAVFCATVCLWLLGGLGFLFEGALPAAWHGTLFGGPDGEGLLSVTTVGLGAVVALVASNTVDWDDLAGIDWGTLVLLGGGISLANAMSDTDATRWLADLLVSSLSGVSVVVLLLAVVALVVVVGELASNTAMAAILVPLLIGVGGAYAVAFDAPPRTASVYLALAGTVAASYSFALPVATPPNAIVYGTGRVGRRHMLRAGAVLDLLMVPLVTLCLLALFRFLLPSVL